MGETIVGYTYNVDEYCDDCMRDIAKREAALAGSSYMWGDCGSAEDVVGEWASMLGIDRSEEDTFESDEFPKRITADQAHASCKPGNGYNRGQCGNRCVKCDQPIGLHCPNVGD